MNSGQFFKLLRKYRSGKATGEEKSFLDAYYNHYEANPDIVQLLSEEEKELLKAKIRAGIREKMDVPASAYPGGTRTLMRRLSIAACFLLLSAFGIYHFSTGKTEKHIVFKPGQQDILPAGNNAVLLLSDGKKIELADTGYQAIALTANHLLAHTRTGQIVYTGNNQAAKNSSDVLYNTIATKRGGGYAVLLPDSSRVYLNAESSLQFPIAFNGRNRQVKLSGEAYFEVAHDPARPFSVSVNQQVISVLGTHFNINGYKDQAFTRTTLLQGSVRITSGGQTATLAPGEQARVDSSHLSAISLAQVDADDALAWRKGLFHFENADLKEVLHEFAKWYDVEFAYRGNVRSHLFSGDIHKDLKLSQALEVLGYSNVHFTIDGRKIIVTPE